jgi:hypothetical protein
VALGTIGKLVLLFGDVGECLGSEFGRNALPHRVRAAFDVGECESVGLRDGMKIAAFQSREDFVGDLVEFSVGDFRKRHGYIRESGEGFSRHHPMTKMKILAH